MNQEHKYKKGDKVVWQARADFKPELGVIAAGPAMLAYNNGIGWKFKRDADSRIIWVREDQLTKQGQGG